MTVHVLKSDKARLQWRRLLEAARKGDDTVIEHYDTPTAALIPYEDYQAVHEYLDDLRASRRAKAAMEEWERDPSTARDWDEIKAEMIRDGLLDG